MKPIFRHLIGRASLALLICGLCSPYSTARQQEGAALPYQIPVLLYHHVMRLDPQVDDPLERGLSVTPESFEEQMKYLSERSYQVLDTSQISSAVAKHKPLPRHSVCITFDDGYEDVYSKAYPALKKYSLKATAFLVFQTVDTRGHLTWDEIREMRGTVTFGSHSYHHLDLTDLILPELTTELRDARHALEERLGCRVTDMSYPFGKYNDHVVEEMQGAGFKGGWTTEPRLVTRKSSPYRLPRLMIQEGDSLARFISIVEKTRN